MRALLVEDDHVIADFVARGLREAGFAVDRAAEEIAPGILTEAAAIKTAAFGLATIASMGWNFILYRTWVFRTVRS